MIGDWVKLRDVRLGNINFVGPIVQIKGIKGKDVSVPNSEGELEDVETKDLLPIPLVPEILEKNGWIKDGYFYKSKDYGDIQLGQLFEHAFLDIDKHGINRRVQTSPSHLQYVHQLQHALRLCGINKEIVL